MGKVGKIKKIKYSKFSVKNHREILTKGIFYERFQPRSHFISSLSIIVRLNVVLNTDCRWECRLPKRQSATSAQVIFGVIVSWSKYCSCNFSVKFLFPCLYSTVISFIFQGTSSLVPPHMLLIAPINLLVQGSGDKTPSSKLETVKPRGVRR